MISVVTPSFNQLDWLRLAIASIADQDQVEYEHIVQDGGTTGIEEFLRPQFEQLIERKRLKIFVEKDAGMYDAINRGLAKSTGEICAYLNCDEQYLPGTLRAVSEFFDTHDEVKVLFGDVILVDLNGIPLSYRRSVLPTRAHLHSAHLNISTCATFFRRELLEQGFGFDPKWRAAGDAVWIDNLLAKKVKMTALSRPLSVFTFTGNNLGATALSSTESREWKRRQPTASPSSRVTTILLHRLRKFAAGAYWPRQVEIDIYTLDSSGKRKHFAKEGVGFSWPRASGDFEAR